jgi:hypothetical protein
MLSVPKQNNQTSESSANANPAGVLSFGKVLGSIQGLQQRLGDFSYADISLAETRVKSLVKQLALVRDNLASIVQLKQAIIEINQQISNIPEENFDLVSLDSLVKHPQLHAIVQASKLIRIQRQIKAARAIADAVSCTIETPDSDAAALALEPAGARATPETDQAIKLTTFGNAGGLTENTVANPGAEEVASIKSKTAQTAPDDSFPTDPDKSSSSATSFEIPPSDAAQGSAKSLDWTFDFNESVAQSSETSAALVGFDFPAETVTDQEITNDKSSANSMAPPRSLTNLEPTVTSQSSIASDASAFNTKHDPGFKPNVGSTSDLHQSTAKVTGGFDLDQRLLDDVIKNYGDFAGTSNPTVISDAEPVTPIVAQPAAETPLEVEKPVAVERNTPSVQKAGDLDRQLKKIIKDYGEYDLYPKQSGISLKTGGIAAFAVLGLVLAGLYFFKSPTPPSGSQTRAVARPTAASPVPAVDADNPANTGASAPSQGADTVNMNSSPLVDPKQRP